MNFNFKQIKNSIKDMFYIEEIKYFYGVPKVKK